MALIPIYTSRGDAEAFLDYPYLFNRIGDWIGWVTPKRDVYSVLGTLCRIFDERSTHPAKTHHIHAQTSASTACCAEKILCTRDDSPCSHDERVDPEPD